MALEILDATVETNCAAATSQQDWITALAEPWADGDVTVRIYGSGDVLRDVITLAPWSTVIATNPRKLVCGERQARTNSSTGDIAKVVFCVGTTEIFSYTAGVTGDGTDLEFFGNIKELCAPNFDNVYVPAPSGLPTTLVPAWVTGTTNKWYQISGTTAPANLGAYSSIALRDDETGVEVFAALGGGHQYTIDNNEVKTLQLDTDTPSWTTRRAASDTTGLATDGTDDYYPSDGRPVCRHTYQAIHWVPELSAYAVGGCFWGSGGTTQSYGNMDIFVPSGSSGGDWSPLPTTYVSTPAAPGALNRQMPSVYDPATGYFYSTVNDSSNRVWRWEPSTDTWTNVTQSGAASIAAGATAWDSTRGNIFVMTGGSWVTTSGTLIATQYNVSTGAKTAITFNSSAGLTDLMANLAQTTYPGMVYDEANDVFYWYAGRQGTLTATDATKVYKVIPNGTTTWDIELIAGSGGVTPPALGDTGIMTKFRYIPRWDMLILVIPSQNVYYMRLS